jgi:hypothetical protein
VLVPHEEPAAVEAAIQDDTAQEPPGLTGLAAVAPPPVAPVVVVAAPVWVTTPAYVPPIYEVAEMADAADAPADDDAVAEAAESSDDGAEVATVQVIDTTIDADQSVHVVSYRMPVAQRADGEPLADTGSDDGIGDDASEGGADD